MQKVCIFLYQCLVFGAIMLAVTTLWRENSTFRIVFYVEAETFWRCIASSNAAWTALFQTIFCTAGLFALDISAFSNLARKSTERPADQIDGRNLRRATIPYSARL